MYAGFRKEQLNVSVTSSGNVRIKGARLIEDNVWMRFEKHFQPASNIDTDHMSSKFLGGKLYLTQPKLNIPSETDQADAEAAKTEQQELPSVSQPQTLEAPPMTVCKLQEAPPISEPQQQESPSVTHPEPQESAIVAQTQVTQQQELAAEPENQAQESESVPLSELQESAPIPQTEPPESAPLPQTQPQELEPVQEQEAPSEVKGEEEEDIGRKSELHEGDKQAWDGCEVIKELIRNPEKLKKYTIYVMMLLIILLGLYMNKMFNTFTKKLVQQQSGLGIDHQEL